MSRPSHSRPEFFSKRRKYEHFQRNNRYKIYEENYENRKLSNKKAEARAAARRMERNKFREEKIAENVAAEVAAARESAAREAAAKEAAAEEAVAREAAMVAEAMKAARRAERDRLTLQSSRDQSEINDAAYALDLVNRPPTEEEKRNPETLLQLTQRKEEVEQQMPGPLRGAALVKMNEYLLRIGKEPYPDPDHIVVKKEKQKNRKRRRTPSAIVTPSSTSSISMTSSLADRSGSGGSGSGGDGGGGDGGVSLSESLRLQEHEAHLRSEEELNDEQLSESIRKKMERENVPTHINVYEGNNLPSTPDNMTSQYTATRTAGLALSNLKNLTKCIRSSTKVLKKRQATIDESRISTVARVLRRDRRDPGVRAMDRRVKTLIQQNIPPPPPHPKRVIPHKCPLFSVLDIGRILLECYNEYKNLLIVAPTMANATIYEVADFNE